MGEREGSKTLWMGDVIQLNYVYIDKEIEVIPRKLSRRIYSSQRQFVLEPYMDEFFILQAFDRMGETAHQVKLIHNKYSGLPQGYCFVDFLDSESAQRAMLRLNGKIIPNSQPPHRFKLNCNNIKDSMKREFSLFVGELTDDVDDYILFQAFAKKYPSCHTAKVVLDNRGNSKGYGFVRFSEETDQQKALIEMQHTTGVGRKTIRVSLATPKKPFQAPDGPSTPGPYAGYQNYGKAYGDYAAYYQQYYAHYYAHQGSSTGPSYNEDQNILEEPELEIDVDSYNKDYMVQSEEIFDVLEDSRWHPMDQWNSTVPASAR